MAREIIGIFLDELPAQIERIESAMAFGKYPEAARESHGLKGAAGNLVAGEIQGIAAKLERLFKASPPGQPAAGQASAAPPAQPEEASALLRELHEAAERAQAFGRSAVATARG